MRLAHKASVVTGAGMGIGRACALRFAREGARLVVADIDRGAAEGTATQIRHEGGKAVAVHVDVALRPDNERMIDACLSEYGSLDILVCNAGVNLPREITETSDDELERLLAVNVKSLVYATRYAVPIMLNQGAGSILIVASKTGLVAQEDSAVYCATKGAAIQLARALALDYARRGIRVNALCPGIIDTPMLRRFADAMPDAEAAWESYSIAQPMGRLGTPEECADAALWLVSNEASFITGIALPVDGGFMAM
jgi:NAD(P)-dependent dehydrogenase (short-subunit alcohol dehydrogenase family)